MGSSSTSKHPYANQGGGTTPLTETPAPNPEPDSLTLIHHAAESAHNTGRKRAGTGTVFPAPNTGTPIRGAGRAATVFPIGGPPAHDSRSGADLRHRTHRRLRVGPTPGLLDGAAFGSQRMACLAPEVAAMDYGNVAAAGRRMTCYKKVHQPSGITVYGEDPDRRQRPSGSSFFAGSS